MHRECYIGRKKQKEKLQILTLPGYVSYFLTVLYFYISARIFYNLLICFEFDSLFFDRFVFECFVLNIRLLLTRTYYVVDFKMLTYFTLSLDPVKLFDFVLDEEPQSEKFEVELFCFSMLLINKFYIKKYVFCWLNKIVLGDPCTNF